MNLNPKVTLDLSTEDIKEIITSKLKDYMPGFAVDAVRFNLSNDYDMRGEHCGSKVTGVQVVFKRVTSSF